MNAIAKLFDTKFQKAKDDDSEYFEALERMRKRKSPINRQVAQKMKSLDLPEISGNLSKKRFFFF